MQKIGVMAASVLAMGADAYRSNSMRNNPFVGENADAEIILGEDRSTHRATPIEDFVGKYDSIISKINRKPEKAPSTQLYEAFFGASEEQHLQSRDSHRSKRLGTSKAIISNDQEDLFAATFTMANKLQMKGLIDSATNLIAVGGEGCNGCGDKTYDISSSVDSGSAEILNDNLTTVSYGQSLFKGYEARDKFCMEVGDCVDLNFNYVQNGYGNFKGVDAVLGFARPNQKMFFARGETFGDADDNFYLQALSNKQEESFFSTRFVRDFLSWIDIGTPDLNQNKTESITFDVLDDYFWSSSNQGVRFGTNANKAYTYHMMEEGAEINGGIYTIFDTAAPSIFMSVLWFESFAEQLFASTGIEYEIRDGHAYSSCSTNFPDLYFLVNGYWIQIQPKDYIREEDSAATQCSLKIKPIDAPFNIFGTPAYIGYYVQHNWNGGYMSWAPHTDSSNADLTPGVRPTQELRIKFESENTPNGGLIAFAITFFTCLILAAGWGYFIYFSYSLEDTVFTSPAEAAGYAFGGFVAIFIFFFIMQWILLLFLMPGNNVQTLPDAEDSSIQVNSTQMGALAFLSYFLYKICGKKNATTEQKVEADTPETTDAAADIDELINSIE